MGYEVESGKSTGQTLLRPVLFGDEGGQRVQYEIDAFHPGLGIAVEVEAGRGAMSNAIHRDLIRTSLMVDAEFLALVVMLDYRSTTKGRPASAPSYLRARDLLDAIYASGRLQLPFQGVLLVGY